jgi:glycosyltransferase involved in cell wall biosynthesis
MPSYNQGAYLEEALRSILLQNYPNLYLVVMDAGSTDESPEILERYRPWLSHLQQGPDNGQAHALNMGFDLAPATGLRGWLNSDDLYLPGAFEAVAHATSTTAATFVYGDALAVDESSGRWRVDHAGYAHAYFRRYPGILFSHAIFWDAKIHEPLQEKLHCSMDYELWIRLLPRAQARHVARPLGVIRIHPAAKSHDPDQAARWDEDAKINGELHPQLYTTGRFHALLHRIVQRMVRRLRRTQTGLNAEAVWRECHWPDTLPPKFN